jgi:membrane associated rhomboid family serine protease
VFPLRDDNPTELTPYVTIAFIVGNVLAWIYLQGAGMSESVLADAVCSYGMIPAELTGRTAGVTGVELVPGRVCEVGAGQWWTALTSMFMHGSWLHLLGNLWFLWLFGNNIEDSLGHLRFLLFYLLTGLAAAAAHVFWDPASLVPTVGASGAISGVMGAYLVLYPRIRIETLFFVLLIFRVRIPAWLVLGQWFAIQLLYGATLPPESGGGGVAFWAHVGGFVAGVLLVKPFENRTLVEARRRHIKLSPWEVKNRGWW